jgi:hypothetical protein
MKNYIQYLQLFLFPLNFSAQSYAPPAGHIGTTAIHKDSSVFVSWATGVSFERGYLQISDTNYSLNGSNKASHGEALDALGPVEGNSLNVLSLGDGGSATLTFDRPIFDGEGPDFAVFENSFQDDFLELAFVEVSSDGTHFFRFPAHSENQYHEQIFSFGLMDCRFVHNLAGKYRQAFGTPFDLSELQDDMLLDKTNITHVRIIDVVGNIEPDFASYDNYGNIVNDPFPTPFESGGFDLDGVGVIHQKPLGLESKINGIQLYPNPTAGMIHVKLSNTSTVELFDIFGKKILTLLDFQEGSVDLQHLEPGVYMMMITSSMGNLSTRMVKK